MDFQIYVDNDEIIVKADRLHMGANSWVGCTTLVFPMNYGCAPYRGPDGQIGGPSTTKPYVVFHCCLDRLGKRFQAGKQQLEEIAHILTGIIMTAEGKDEYWRAAC